MKKTIYGTDLEIRFKKTLKIKIVQENSRKIGPGLLEFLEDGNQIPYNPMSLNSKLDMLEYMKQAITNSWNTKPAVHIVEDRNIMKFKINKIWE